LQDPCLLPEIETAVRTTLTSGIGIGHSLCHGDLGNIELVRTALEQMPDHFGGLSLEAPLAGIVESIRRSGWLCGNPRHIESPGLMTGIAGIGYGLLRLAAPETVPSVLALEAPYTR
jgi:lantibiotic modifying enzyme